ncbi:MAG: hypothetical protein V4850_32540 [Myxococcota bacterium]
MAITIAVTAMNAWVAYAVERAPDVVYERVSPYKRGVDGPHIVTFGSCHGDVFLPAEIEPVWGNGARVWNLSFKETAPLDWTLLLSGYVADSPDLLAVVVLFTNHELRAFTNPWESQTMGLVSWQDLPGVVRTNCLEVGCAGEAVLRKGWAAYRQRAWLGGRFWTALGVRMPGMRGGSPTEAPRGAYRPPPGGDAPPVGAVAPGSAVASGSAAAQGGAVALGNQRGPSWFSVGDDPYHWTQAFLDEARRRGIPALFVSLPSRPGAGVQPDSEGIAYVKAHGGEVLDIAPEPPLTAADYTDDAHLDFPAQPKVARAIGVALRGRFSGGG